MKITLMALLLTCLIGWTSRSVHSDELVIFKQVADDVGIDGYSFTLPYTVWQVDALASMVAPIKATADAMDDPRQAVAFVQRAMAQQDPALLNALFMISIVAREKIERYGLRSLPSAVRLDERGQVVQRIDPLVHVRQLENTP